MLFRYRDGSRTLSIELLGMTDSKTYVSIIGAGPAGLAMAACLTRLQIPHEIYEESGQTGNAWRNHYDRLHLHTVRSLSHLPYMPMPRNYPQYPSRQQVVDYLEMYAQHFDIQPHFQTCVTSVIRKNGAWEIGFDGRPPVLCAHVVFATGVNRKPNIPVWPGQESFSGKIFHSKTYRNPQDTDGHRVLVIGMGNTGAEIALDLAEQGRQTYLSVRSPVSIIPRDINGRPTQLTGRLLEKLPFRSGEWIGHLISKLVVGDLEKYGIPQSRIPPAQQLKQTGKTPTLDIGTVKYIKAGKIRVLPEIESFGTNCAITRSGRKIEVDTVVLATGYRAGLDDFLETTDGLLDQNGVPVHPIGQGNFKGLYFIGFDNYQLGGILGTIRTDAEKISKCLSEEFAALP